MYFIEVIDRIVTLANSFLYTYILVFLLFACGVYYTIKMRFIQFNIKEIIGSFKETETISTNSRKLKKVSAFESFALTTASRVGTGNLAGVAIAIVAGGPGVLFWMWITALTGGALAFAECLLAQLYKKRNTSYGTETMIYKGGPPYYIEQGLKSKPLAVFFAISLIFMFGFSFNAVQANTIADSMKSVFNLPIPVTALILSILVTIFIIKGLPQIAKFSAFLVPFMSIFYLSLCSFVIIVNFSKIPSVFHLIIESAFGFKEFGLGTFMGTLVTGIRRGLFSNEAGMGSAPNAAAASESSHPAKQGFIQAFGVFFDTLLICSATGFLILLSGVDISNKNISGIVLTQRALESYFGSFGGVFLAICILLLAFSSILGNYFYAENGILFLTENKIYKKLFHAAVVGSVFLGCLSPFSFIWNLADFLMGIIALINLYAIVMLSKKVQLVLDNYKQQRAKNLNPVFNKNSIPNLEDLDSW